MSSTIDTPETSVMFSLAELADIEEKRVREEAIERARRREEQARERTAAEQQQREAEAVRVAAAAEARQQRERERAKAIVKSKAREQAELDVARITAEGKARLETDNAARAHELAILRVKSASGHARLRRVLAAVLGAVLLAGSGAAYAVNNHLRHLEQQSQRLRDDRWALIQSRDKEMAAELMALDRRHDALRERSGPAYAKPAEEQAAAARAAVEAGGVDAAKLRAIGEALDDLDVRLDRADRLAEHDRRLTDLAAWARSTRKAKRMEAARSAAARAHRSPDSDDALAAYGRALDGFRKTLSADGGAKQMPQVTGPPQDTKTVCTDPHDPLCGLDGKQLAAP